ncbi:cytochrome P450 [Sphaerisporangium album]|uniref:Cytochrome P450 n=1 Tax=Sphaerisporangium album TaxID=509200 RepID=A0A367FAF8_9ACTN|nr:cytochrome P450 [Sphaerisporangium album]RCG27251.1 cytochrome P450 [Sphaerisporangium album]
MSVPTVPAYTEPVRPVPASRTPLLGNLPEFARDPLAFFTRLRDDHGDMVEWRLGRQRCLFLARPDHVGEVLAGAESTFVHAQMPPTFLQLHGEGMVNSSGDAWRRKRALVQPAIRPRQVRAYARTMAQCAEEFADGLKAGERLDIRRHMLKLTQRIAVRTLFGTDTAEQEATVGRTMEVAQREIGAELGGFASMVPSWVPTPGRLRLKAAITELDAEVLRLIKAHKQSAGEREDLISRLMTARDEQGRSLTDREVRDEAVTLYVAGHETTGTTLTWAWYLLSDHPEVLAKLAGEAREVFQDRFPDHDDYPRLTYTQQVIKETLRLYPPVWLVYAHATERSTVGGVRIPAGSRVYTSPWVTHRDPRWFPDPEEFRPERWTDAFDATLPAHAWFPFGGGPRACPGARFALVESVLVLATVARRFSLRVDPGEIPAKAALTLQPGREVPGTVVAA